LFFLLFVWVPNLFAQGPPVPVRPLVLEETAEVSQGEIAAGRAMLGREVGELAGEGDPIEALTKRLTEAEEKIGSLESSREALEKQLEDAKKSAKEKKKPWYEKLTLRGYAQVRISDNVSLQRDSFPPHLVGDPSVGDNQSFSIRRARLILQGDVHEHLGVYLQPDFAALIPGVNDSIQFTQVRDWYGDFYIDKTKVHRLRIGQSKIPYGWENMQSSSNRLPLDRSHALNSDVKNERDIGVIYYWTPEPAQEFFKEVIDMGLKGSGNYGMFAFGFYNGQGGSFREQNDNIHMVARFLYPGILANGQRYELGMQGYAGEYVVLTSPISPNGVGPAIAPFSNRDGTADNRLAWTAVYYPQPLGFQSEWTIGRGPSLDGTQTVVEESSLTGGYVQTMYQIKNGYGTWFPYARYNYFRGGYKSERNSPATQIDEFELGLEWQIHPAAELTTSYTMTDRTNTIARSQADTLSYGQFQGTLLRFQFQMNY
jgi:hypothetical protein